MFILHHIGFTILFSVKTDACFLKHMMTMKNKNDFSLNRETRIVDINVE